jgi:hypothetical protein
LSSTILYLAIVAIWAGVLVPRWLRRDPHPETSAHSQDPAADGSASGVPAAADSGASGIPASAAAKDEGRPERGSDGGLAERRGRERVMAARRRLFGILTALAVSAAAIAAAGLATWWVVAPPAGMLAGYVLLLREAARADAELTTARGSAATADGAGRAGYRARPVAGSVAPAVDQVNSTVAGTKAAAAGAEASATAEVVDIMSRVDEELYDQYADAKLRAVGD